MSRETRTGIKLEPFAIGGFSQGKFSEKLEAAIQKHKEHWDDLYADLFVLSSGAESGRKDAIEGVNAKAVPFYELMGQLAFGEKGFPPDHVDAARQLVSDVMTEFEETIDIINF